MKNLSVLVLIALCFGCTDNQKARSFGGKETVTLKPNEVLMNITWKGEDMWILTEDTTTHMQYFRESSSFGIWEGEVTITH